MATIKRVYGAVVFAISMFIASAVGAVTVDVAAGESLASIQAAAGGAGSYSFTVASIGAATDAIVAFHVADFGGAGTTDGLTLTASDGSVSGALIADLTLQFALAAGDAVTYTLSWTAATFASVLVSASAVPLPAPLLMLLSALGVIAWMRRQRNDTTSQSQPADLIAA